MLQKYSQFEKSLLTIQVSLITLCFLQSLFHGESTLGIDCTLVQIVGNYELLW
jgi:hypothetical protein